jgi:hypothetical protein
MLGMEGSINATGFRPSGRSLGLAVWAFAVLMSTGACLGQPSEEALRTFEKELEAKIAGKPYAVATDPLVKGKIVHGIIETPGPDPVLFRFTVAAGSMLYVTNTLSGEEFSYVVTPNVAVNSEGNAVPQPQNSDAGSDVAIRAFSFSDQSELTETEFRAISTKRQESFTDSDGSNCTLNIQGILEGKPGGGVIHTGSTCCVSCGTYQICAATVTSSCGSCSAGGPGRGEIRDGPPPG